MKTKWSLNELTRYEGETLNLSGEMDLEKELKNRSERILSVTPVKFEGVLSVDGREYTLFLKLNCSLVLPSTRSLKPAEVPMKTEISEVYVPSGEADGFEYEDPDLLVIELEQDLIDLKETALENLLAALPSKVLTEDEEKGAGLPEGNGWRVVTEEQAKKRTENESEGDPRFAALKSLFPDSDSSK